MKELVYNYDNLKEEEIDEEVVRGKALIINSNNEIILGYSDKSYQFLGGHLLENESVIDCLVREVKEESGIDISDEDLIPFVKIIYYVDNYRNKGIKRKNIIYYYIIKTDDKVNMNKSSLDEVEQKLNFEIKVIPLNEVEELLKNSINDNPINEIIVEEMLDVLKEYNMRNV